MRIIAGKFRGHRIASPPGEGTRPMLDRVREALFATLGERVEGARVLDLYAGTGSLGFEAFSRGAELVRMVESDGATVAVCRQNSEKLKAVEAVQVVRGDALSERGWVVPPSGTDAGPGWDVVFLDPPYAEMEKAGGRASVLAALHSLVTHRLASDGIVVLHAPKRALRTRDFGGLPCEERAYGSSVLWYVEPAQEVEQGTQQ